MKKLIISIYFFIFLITPVFFAYAYTPGFGIVPVCNKGELQPVPVLDSAGNKIINEKGDVVVEYQLGPTKCDFGQLIALINISIDFLLFYVASPLAAIIFCYAGFKLLTSGGNQEAMGSAKKMILHLILGYIIALAAWLIIHTIVKSIGLDPTIDTFMVPK